MLYLCFATSIFIDAEIRETTEEKTEETDVEEQFSPLNKSSPAKQALDLELAPEKSSFFPESSPDLLTSSDHQLSDSGVLTVTNTLLVGPSPTDQLCTIGEDDDGTEQIMKESIELDEKDIQHRLEMFSEDVTTDSLREIDQESQKLLLLMHERPSLDSPTSDQYQGIESTTQIESGVRSEIEDEGEGDKKKTAVSDLQSLSDIGKDDSVDSYGEPDEGEHHERASHLTYMAFDNMAFSADDSEQGAVGISAQASVPKHLLQKQDTKDISPEDLEEKPFTFDFQEEELEQHQEIASTTERVERTVEKRRYTEEREDYSKEIKELTSYSESSHLESLLETKESSKSDTLIYHEEQKSRVEQSIISAEEIKIAETVHIVKEDITSEFLKDDESRFESKEEKHYSVEGPLQAPDLIQDVSSADATEQEMEQVDESSSDSSTDKDNEIFDELSGTYITVPWEVAHQFKRQFSESLIEQEKKTSLKSCQSIDMGSFYRRIDKDTSDFPSVSFTEVNTDLSTLNETSKTPLSKSKQVTFQLYDSEFIEEEEIKIGFEIPSEPVHAFEPHDLIENTHEAEVMFTILENRRNVKEEIARHETSLMQSEYFSPVKEFDKFIAEVSEESKQDIIDSMAAQCSRASTEQFTKSQYQTESSSAKLFREDSTDSRPDDQLFPVQTTPVSVVNKESRLAQQELLQEMGDEKDRSVSPSVDSEELSTTYESQAELQEELGAGLHHAQHSSKFPMAVHSLGKALVDNEIYESSETERDSTEEKLSPIEEAPTGEISEEILCDQSMKMSQAEKKVVTFQTDTLATRSMELHSEDIKTSTSSSEVSVEPTLLAASYDLDTGHVSRVVTAYDISPDSVDKQTIPEVPAKSILSSPEDDVFETDASAITPTMEEEDSVIMMSSKLSSGSELYPSPPAPTPQDAVPTETTYDLATASSKLEQIQHDDASDTPITETTPDEFGSPFEMMSPSELIDLEFQSEVSTEVASSCVQLTPEMSTGIQTSVEEFHGEQDKDSTLLLNGPTEVEYNANYDSEIVESTEQQTAELTEQGLLRAI